MIMLQVGLVLRSYEPDSKDLLRVVRENEDRGRQYISKQVGTGGEKDKLCCHVVCTDFGYMRIEDPHRKHTPSLNASYTPR